MAASEGRLQVSGDQVGFGGYQASAGEIAAAGWFKSSFSAYSGSCVEVASLGPGRIGVRDTKANGQGSVLIFSVREWRSFLASVQ
jgi:hypothetical protein